MLLRLFLLFTLVPVVELYMLIRVGRVIGPLPTVATLAAAALAGAWLAKRQGFLILSRIGEELAAGRMPGSALLDAALVLCGGILLVTPGFFTDLLGLLFL
ncbi:MAG TPA: FxsA family protein, partial [Verrucomicrobiae bacterium]|nr:FxsA family protein [Verrucomicrobiae bacterium]